MGKSTKNKQFKAAKYYSMDSEKARGSLEKLMSDPNYKNKALLTLATIELRDGRYVKARELLEGRTTYELKLKLGLLEEIEFNYEASKACYSECLDSKKMYTNSLLALAKLYVQTGDYESAKKLFEDLLNYEDYYIDAIYGLIIMNIVNKNYDEALNFFREIDDSKIIGGALSDYHTLRMYLFYFMGEQIKLDYDNYRLTRLFNNDDGELLKHVEKHKEQKDRYTKGCFFDNLDLEELLDSVSDKIADMNANHFGLVDMYRFKMDRAIGLKGDSKTNDICVVTVLGTERILTMYPVDLSKKFNKEDQLYSKTLMLKRNGNNIL